MVTTQELRALEDSKDAEMYHSRGEIKGMGLTVESRDIHDGDEDQLARLGKKQVLRVRHQRLRVCADGVLTPVAELRILVHLGV